MREQQQEHSFDDEQNRFVYVDEPGTNHSGKSAVYIVSYFLLLAIVMIPAQRVGLGMQGVFLAMAGAALLLLLCILLFKFTRRRIEAMKISKRGFMQMLVGYRPEQEVLDQERDLDEEDHQITQ